VDTRENNLARFIASISAFFHIYVSKIERIKIVLRCFHQRVESFLFNECDRFYVDERALFANMEKCEGCEMYKRLIFLYLIMYANNLFAPHSFLNQKCAISRRARRVYEILGKWSKQLLLF